MPLASEVRGSDLLAALAEADPTAAATAFALASPLGQPRVRREVTASGKDRGDLLLYDGGQLRAVVEVKVLAGLSRGQPVRYRVTWPGAETYVVLSPQRLPVHVAVDAGWTPLSWEVVLRPSPTARTRGWQGQRRSRCGTSTPRSPR